MSETKLATKADLQEMYQRMLPYLGGSADAGFTPIGTIIALMGNHAPANYLICDGTVYNIADYPELANHFLNEFGSKNYFGGNGTTTFAVPSLQGEFLRGAGTNSHANQGSGANVGVHQDGTEFPACGSWNSSTTASTYTLELNNNNANNWGATQRKVDKEFGNTANSRKFAAQPQGNIVTVSENKNPIFTSRPTNTSVLYCIATKNFYIDPTLDYSTDEKVVGTWIDGKPIYQKTFSEFITLDDSSKEMQYDHNIANIDNVISASGFSKNPTNNRSYAFPQAYSDTYYYFLSANSLKINVERLNPLGWAGHKCTATLQYTKTTD